ncbi:immunoglobulin superfamily member 1-like [Sarcophilus harrisii]|uniref:immunoglobulin superfamily member 1-like n=1 Tax=Sarcophilus harrisii TaxID=9305 RepID=UPI001301B353|nr:immunoglobulin superfamily member 1-like [Sarcophilus harrisii]
MDSTVTFLISIGLCLHWEITAEMDALFRPTLWADPSPVVPEGGNVILRCQGGLESDRFQLWKDGELRAERNDSWSQADFVLKKVNSIKDARSYRCRSGQGPLWSELSDSLILVVTAGLPTPSILSSHGFPVSPATTVTFWCQMPSLSSSHDYIFALLEAKSLEPLQLQSPAESQAAFSLPYVKAEDSGSYSCIYYRKTPPYRGSNPSLALELTVSGPLPKPTLWAKADLVVAPGTNSTLWCSRPRLSSLKEVTFTLQKAGTPGPLQQQPSADLWTDFSLPSVTPGDTGSYSCTYKDRTASGRESVPSDALELVVPGSLPKPSLSALPNLVVEPGQHVTLQCRQPPRSAFWRATFALLKVGSPQPLQSQSPTGTSAVFPFLSVRAQDTGNYTCVYYGRMAPYQVSEPSEVLEIQVTDHLPKPSLSASPGQEVVSGTNVTLLCWGPSWATRFILYKEGVEEIPHSMEAHEDRGQFLLSHVTPKHSGNYSCSYQLGTNKSLWKQRSDAMELLVRDPSNNFIIILLSCVSFLLLLLCLLLFAFLCHGSIPMGFLWGCSLQSCFCCSCLTWRTCLPHHPEAPRDESPYSEIAKDRTGELFVPRAEGPQEVTYSQLNLRTLNKKKGAAKEIPTEPIIYDAVYLD